MHTLEQLRSGALAGTRRLDLACGLTAVPPEVFDLADSLEVLNLSGNALTALPPDLPRLKQLKVIFCSDNAFTHLPEVLGDCPGLEMVGFKANQISHVPAAALPPALRWLILTDNALAQLPDALGERPALQKLMLAGNRLAALPDSLAQAQRLELIRLSANRFTQLPGWLPRLPALAWAALAGNPWCGEASATLQATQTACPDVAWADLLLDAKLGEGASGHIYRAHLRPGSRLGSSSGDGALAQSLALKLFKGSVTSDGLPDDELAASLHAGQHPALTTPVARVTGHPDNVHGVLLPLLPHDAVNLAGPPSLASCTRDVYAPGAQWPEPVGRTLVNTLAGAVAHLHARGVMHGDLYAHNILWRPEAGQAWLGDFGAATVLAQGAMGQATAASPAGLTPQLLALEVRAFGILLEEVAQRCVPLPGSDWPTRMQALAQVCMQPDVAARPPMGEVWQALCP